MSPNLKRILAEVEKPDGSKSQEGDGRHKEKPIRSDGTAPPLGPCCLPELAHPKPTSESQERETQGIQSLQRLWSQQRPSTFPAEKEASIPCDVVQAGDINSF